LNREAADKKPSLSELRDSGAIEQDADGVLMLWMPDGRPADEGYSATRLCMNVAKNRHGALRDIEFNWFMATGNILQADIR
jgi:replicative DNA helicase